MSLFLVGSTFQDTSITLWKLSDNGAFEFLKDLPESVNSSRSPSWFDLSPCSKFLFSVNEAFGEVSSFSVDKNQNNEFSGLTHLNSVNSGSDSSAIPTYLTLSSELSTLFIGNYGSGMLTVVPVSSDGSGLLKNPTQTFNHNIVASDVARVHQTKIGTNQDVLYTVDLGMDAIYTYEMSQDATGAGKPLTELAVWKVPKGTGPRHLTIGKDNTWAYVVCELSNQVIAVPIDSKTHVVGDDNSPVKASFYSSIPDLKATGDTQDMGGAEILQSSDGKFLYVSNRDISATSTDVNDRSCITVFAIVNNGAELKHIQSVRSRGNHPRHMALTQGGTRLLVANRGRDETTTNGQSFALFRVDLESGLLDESSVVVSPSHSSVIYPGYLLELQ
jgi:6-phosphogluconolactonase